MRNDNTDACAYAAALARQGVPHELHSVADMPHGFLQRFDLAGCDVGWELMVAFLRRVWSS